MHGAEAAEEHGMEQADGLQDAVDGIFGWVVQYWWVLAIVVGVIVVALIALMLWPGSKIQHSAEHPTDTREANDLALGFIQIRNADGQWNDPTAKHLVDDPKLAQQLRDQWGLYDTAAWEANIDRLVTVRRQRPLWQQLLAIRADLMRSSGKAPSIRAWQKAVRAAGGTGKGEEQAFIEAVGYYEDQFKETTNKRLFPSTLGVVDFDGYALNQAVALATWGVGLGIATPERSRERIAEVNAIARAQFASWEDFGRSVVIGRAMHWSDGAVSEGQVKASRPTAWDFERAVNPKLEGPWARLPWRG